MSTDYQIILCTCPDKNTAEKIAYLLVENNVAACVNIVPNMTSIYRWQGEIERAEEYLLLIKARQDSYSQLESLIKQHITLINYLKLLLCLLSAVYLITCTG